MRFLLCYYKIQNCAERRPTSKIHTVTLNPALDKTVQVPNFRPGEVNRIADLRTDPGGKGINVSKVLHALAEPSVAAAILGGAAGQRIADALQAIGVEGLFLFTQHETRTNLKLIDPVQHTNTDINEPGASVPPETADELFADVLAVRMILSTVRSSLRNAAVRNFVL